MNSNSLILLPVSESARNFRKKADAFFEVSQKIRKAWDAMGYEGDPIFELMAAIQGMYVWAQK